MQHGLLATYPPSTEFDRYWNNRRASVCSLQISAQAVLQAPKIHFWWGDWVGCFCGAYSSNATITGL